MDIPRIRLAVCSLLPVVCCAPALAQESPMLPELVVTATRTSTDLADAPAAFTVISAKQI
jgi:outer membrane cobalamin receptor